MSEVEYPEGTEFKRFADETGSSGVMVFAEMVDGHLLNVGKELMGPAREMADYLGVDVTAFLISDAVGDAPTTLIALGADKVVVAEDERLASFTTLPYTRALSDYITDVHRPEIMLMGATTTGRDLAPRVASRIDAGVTADCTKLAVGPFYHKRSKSVITHMLEAHRPSFGESKLACIMSNPQLLWAPAMATARPGIFIAPKADASRTGEIIPFTPNWQDGDFAVEILEVRRGGGDRIDLASPRLIVSGGVPCGATKFAEVHALVNALKAQGIDAEWGASRAAVDAGFAPSSRQVGQTGQSVRPAVYVAVAISGAPQHMVGMKDSARIIAVNTDSACTMVNSADAAIISDYRTVLPALTVQVEAGFTFGL